MGNVGTSKFARKRVRPDATESETIRGFYRELYDAWGAQHWWPAQSRFEVIVGAYLTQNTSWTNVERALGNLRRARVLNLKGIRTIPIAELERHVRPAGYYLQKAARLKRFVEYLDSTYEGSLDRMFAQSTDQLRRELLELNGIGPETADSILLYAGNHPVFVVDAYTRRILERHRVVPLTATYEEVRALFESALRGLDTSSSSGSVPKHEAKIRPLMNKGAAHNPSRMSVSRRSLAAQMFNEMHGLIVSVGKRHCFKKAPECESCPLRRFLTVRS